MVGRASFFSPMIFTAQFLRWITHRVAWGACCALAMTTPVLAAAETAREVIARATLAPNDAQKREIIASLSGQGDEAIAELLAAWRQDALFIFTTPEGAKIPVQLVGEKQSDGRQAVLRIDTGMPLLGSDGQALLLSGAALERVRHTTSLRRSMKLVLDVLDLVSPDPARRLQAVQTMGFTQDIEKLPLFKERLAKETDKRVVLALREAIAVTELKLPDQGVKLAALKELEELATLSSSDILNAALREATAAGDVSLIAAAKSAVAAVESHRSTVNFIGTIFRGLSLGSILLVLALGLAITFGLMGVINMAHGEMIAVGAYTTYLVQNIFGSGITIPFFGLSLGIPGMGLSGWGYQLYFIAAIPLSFLMAALVGIALERGVIQFLYRRPLESLLATWGVSLVLQQVFKLMFGANNVQVSSPVYLAGNWTVNDIIFGWNRVFVIGFALMIVLGVWLVLTKTPLGLLIRAVMQNRGMASCMGVRTERVNMMTFGLGSGLAGLAGAFLSQIGNVGPSLGQNYIVDCFMTVVVGGVGNLPGTVISAFGIGLTDQSLQQILLNPVLGKIVVLLAIILFLQWRPAGIFVTRSRSLDD
jgi:urea transport system permease protein